MIEKETKGPKEISTQNPPESALISVDFSYGNVNPSQKHGDESDLKLEIIDGHLVMEIKLPKDDQFVALAYHIDQRSMITDYFDEISRNGNLWAGRLKKLPNGLKSIDIHIFMISRYF